MEEFILAAAECLFAPVVQVFGELLPFEQLSVCFLFQESLDHNLEIYRKHPHNAKVYKDIKIYFVNMHPHEFTKWISVWMNAHIQPLFHMFDTKEVKITATSADKNIS